MWQLVGIATLIWAFHKTPWPWIIGIVVLFLLMAIWRGSLQTKAPEHIELRGRSLPRTPRKRKGAAPSATMNNLPSGSISRGIIIDEPWITKILTGEKIWEMRSRSTKLRGTIALIRKGSGAVVGLADLRGVVGPLDDASVEATFDKHRVPLHRIGKWRYAWTMAHVRRLSSPIPYVHKSGAVTIVVLDPKCSREIDNQLSGRSVGAT